MNAFQRPLFRQVCGPYLNSSLAAVLALMTASVSPGVARAHDRSLRLHAASHAGGRVAVAASAETHKKSRGGNASRRGGNKTAKTPVHPSKAAPSEKSRGKASRRHHRDPEVVDDPVTVHRAGMKPMSRKAAARERMLARERDASPRGRRQRGHIEIAASKGKAMHRGAENEAVGAARSLVLARSNDAVQKTPAAPTSAPARNAASAQAAPQMAAALQQGESHPDDDGDVTSVQTIDASRVPARSVVVRSQADNEGEVSATTQAPRAPASRVITGFGAEVAAAPASAPTHTSPEATRQQEQMDLADDTESDGVTPPSPRALADDAMQPRVLPLYTRNGRLMMPAPLKGSREILVHQNIMADRDGLERIRDDRDLNRLRTQHMLVSFPESASLRVNYSLPENRRYARPWTVRFAADAARAFYAQFGDPLQVNSAVRTVSYQRRLQRVNGNAAATSGDGASPHLTGQAIDLAKRGMTSDEIGWMRSFLLPLIEAGKIDVEEEFQQACFHISVYRAYMPAPRKQTAPKMQVAQLRAEQKVTRSLPAMPATNESNDQ